MTCEYYFKICPEFNVAHVTVTVSLLENGANTVIGGEDQKSILSVMKERGIPWLYDDPVIDRDNSSFFEEAQVTANTVTTS